MTAVEIVLIMIGFACVCISFFVAGKKKGQSGQTGEEVVDASIWTEKEEQMIRSRIMDLLEEEQAELIDSTEERMNRLCNEKIMAIDEFSKPLLEKIETNHQEVVFMYNLLNEKEKDVKKVVSEPIVDRDERKEPVEPVSGLEKAAAKKEKKKAVTPKQPELGKEQTVPTPEKKTAPKQIKQQIKQGKEKPVETIANVHGDEMLKIQKMYKEGKSVLEISKALNMGQGEVKLVIALYGGRAR